MLILLSMLVLFTAIVGFFSREIIDFISRLFSIPGVKLVLPILLMSLLIESDSIWGWWGLSSFRSLFSVIEQWIVKWMPFQTAEHEIARIVLLTLVGCLPTGIAVIRSRKKPLSTSRYFAYRLGFFLWVVSVIVVNT